MAGGKTTPRAPGDAAFRRNNLRGSDIEPTYAGALSFMRRKYTRELKAVDVAVTGIPFDQAVSNRPGTRFGPEAIRRASANFAWGPQWPWFFDPFDTLAVVDYGDCYLDWGAKQDAPVLIENHARDIIKQGVSMVSLGGDHFVTYPLLKAHANKHGPLSLIHFDAHRDVERDDPRRIDHGTMFSRAIEEGILDPTHSIQIGIRTTFEEERTHGMTILYADRVHGMTAAEVAGAVRKAVGRRPSYLTFDIDCLDPAFAPGTGTPVPGGLSSFQALSIVRELKDIGFVGMDVVEVSPPYDHADTTALAAAAVVLEYLCLCAWRKGARGEKMRR